jgi:hypothetical protein
MQSRKQHQRIPSRNDEKPKFPTNRNDDVSMLPGDPERVTRVSSITKKVSKKNLKAKSPLRFTNKYRKTPISFDVSEKRVRCSTSPFANHGIYPLTPLRLRLMIHLRRCGE